MTEFLSQPLTVMHIPLLVVAVLVARGLVWLARAIWFLVDFYFVPAKTEAMRRGNQ
jgi:hypothetical protein